MALRAGRPSFSSHYQRPALWLTHVAPTCVKCALSFFFFFFMHNYFLPSGATKNCLFISVSLSELELFIFSCGAQLLPQVTDVCVLHANRPVSLGVGETQRPTLADHNVNAEGGNTELCPEYILIANCWKRRLCRVSGRRRELCIQTPLVTRQA